MTDRHHQPRPVEDDEKTLRRLGYAQELARRMGAFSNFAISLSIICILAGGITSFHQGYCGVGGASIGLGWPLVCLFSLVVAATMGQLASPFPTAGGLYHWASILGGRGWGWTTAWFNLVGLVFVTAAINVGTYQFLLSAFGPRLGLDPESWGGGTRLAVQLAVVTAITLSHAVFNHFGIRLTSLLTDFSGWLILVVAVALTAAMLAYAGHLDFDRLVRFQNYSGLPEGDNPVWPKTDNLLWLFALGFLLPAYTMTGFDASAHTAEETVGAAVNAPRGIVRSVLVSGVFGWVMLCAVVLAIPDCDEAARKGPGAFYWIVGQVLPGWLGAVLYAGIGLAQCLCGLAALTSISRMAYAFARDGGLPFSHLLRRVSRRRRTPSAAIWVAAAVVLLFTVYTPVYDTIAAAAAVFLYVSYVLPTALGLWAHGRTWTRMGPWHLGRLYRPLAAVCVAGCALLLVIGVQPPNEKNLWIVGAMLALLAALWLGVARREFPGPPTALSLRQEKSP
jgi:amino acid transporter